MKLELSKTTLKMEPNSVYKLDADHVGFFDLTWSSSNEDVAIVRDGTIYSRTVEGTAVITATDGDLSASCNVTVAP